jgi:peptidyl-dipeptidase Dcp
MLRRTFLQSAAATVLLAGCTANGGMELFGEGDAAARNPLLDEWRGPHGGVPLFDQVRVADIKPALLTAMDLGRAEYAAIAASSEAPNFENTVAVYENSGRAFDRVETVYDIYTSTMNDAEMKKIEAEVEPVIAAYRDEIIQNEGLFKRIKAVYDARTTSNLTPEQQRVTDVIYTRFVRRGAALDAAGKARAKEINQRLAALYTTFSQNVLSDEENYTLVLESEADLAGLSESQRAGAAAAAKEKNLAGKWVITNTRSSMDPFLTFSTRRDLREKGWRMWTMRGDNGDAHDNKATMREILMLRAERAKLLGYPTHAHWVTADNMAKTPEAAMNLMMKVWKAAAARAREEVADMQKIADQEGAKIKIEPWDYRFYAEKVRKAKYDLDQNEVKAYLKLESVRDGMFWAAGQLFGYEFKPVTGVPLYQPDTSVYEVTRDGEHVSLWYFDPYARTGKRSGAWMNAYRSQERFKEDITPIVSNNSNFVKADAGLPVLISWDDADTMFHEFGHAVHGLSSNVNYPTLAGTKVKRDFVEFPSQIYEHWLPTQEVLNKFLLHYETGKPMPAELVAKIEKAKNFNQGFATVEYLAAAIYDMKIHLAASPDKAIDPEKFERDTMKEIGCPKEIVMRHRPTQFGHIFSGDGYSAGYYNYIWADTLTADAWEAFDEAGNPWDKATAKRLMDTILSVGNTVPADVAFRNFRGRDVNTDALMRDRGFAVETAQG